MAAGGGGGGGQVSVAAALTGTPSYSSQHLRPGLILSAPRGHGRGVPSPGRGCGAAPGGPGCPGGPSPKEAPRGPGRPALPHCTSPMPGWGARVRPMVNSGHWHIPWVPQPWPCRPACPQASCQDPPFPTWLRGCQGGSHVYPWPLMSSRLRCIQPLSAQRACGPLSRSHGQALPGHAGDRPWETPPLHQPGETWEGKNLLFGHMVFPKSVL